MSTASAKPPAIDRGDTLQRLLCAELARAGCFRLAPLRSALYAVFIVTCYAGAYATLLAAPAPALRLLAIAAAAFATVHAAFLAHEAGHGAVTRNRRRAALVGQLSHTLLTGLSYTYFRHIHSIHHPHCNDRGRDPDMQCRAFALYPQSAPGKRGPCALIARHQAWLLWLLVGLQGFTLRLDGLAFVWRHPRRTRLDRPLLLAHFALWALPPALALGWVDALLNYAAASVLVGFYVGSIFVVNHVGTRVVAPDARLSHFEQEISTTRNLGVSRLADFLCGGLNNHVEHHLFPSIPRARLRVARRITRAFCCRHDVAYREMSWPAAAREVTRHLAAMAALVPRPARGW